MLTMRFKPPTNKATKWSELLNQDVDLDSLLLGLERERVCTINSQLRSFNYNFFMCNVPCESRLFHMKIKPTNECQHCGVKESMLHLYWEYPNSCRLWERLQKERTKHLNINLALKRTSCLLNLDNTKT